ncbi:methylmalonyl Co-A mutase-associated GTPase MeaB [Aminobacter carboxidus]|uniref:Methylmalonyl Co-A mutase-associated GTPase MeaB n=1 Tax=Aminobacter carboxidus TaxID=376165 RepID=A0ABR9GR11_9HYPH|nr:methylmalonyl Co-A mutase-associated GTPase MeaB [Aminobacter carboxidus]MBE1206073.1 methylmalonyl Co-A mutase-associated GTPase MeaB [Aminobacter carboxidus]
MATTWRRLLAKSLSAIENRSPGWREVLARAYAEQQDSLVLGVTGPPGVGKSTLIDALAAEWCGQGHRVGIIAVDPASPFSGGAVLGDRVRMRRCEDLDEVFIRSMSARGHSGGLTEAAVDLSAVMASFGVSRILLETVGVGQNEVDVAFVADCTLVVSVPGLGDSVQAAKAGLMEVGDIYVVNKGDLPGAATVKHDLGNMLALVFAGRPGRNEGKADRSMLAAVPGATRQRIEERYGDATLSGGAWHPPVVTVTASDAGVAGKLIEAIEACADWIDDSGQHERRRRHNLARHLRSILQRRLLDRHLGAGNAANLDDQMQEIIAGRSDPHRAAERIMDKDHADE